MKLTFGFDLVEHDLGGADQIALGFRHDPADLRPQGLLDLDRIGEVPDRDANLPCVGACRRERGQRLEVVRSRLAQVVAHEPSMRARASSSAISKGARPEDAASLRISPIVVSSSSILRSASSWSCGPRIAPDAPIIPPALTT